MNKHQSVGKFLERLIEGDLAAWLFLILLSVPFIYFRFMREKKKRVGSHQERGNRVSPKAPIKTGGK